METGTILACPIRDGPWHMVEILDDNRPDGAVGVRKIYYCPYHQKKFHEKEVVKVQFKIG